MKRILFLSLFILANFFLLVAQIPVGNWRMHFSYNNTTQVAQTPEKVFAVADGKLFSVDKTDNSVQGYSKMTGLSDNDVALISYSSENKVLVIAYTNSNIDIVDMKGNTYNIPDLYRKVMSVSKNINHIYFLGNYAYFSCDFGIMVLDLVKQEILDTYVIGDDAEKIPVYSLASDGEYFYALTQNSIKRAKVQGVNLSNYENWKDEIPLPDGSSNFRFMEYFGSKLFVVKNNENVYQYENNSWSVFFENTTEESININTSGNYLMINNTARIRRYAKNFDEEILDNIVVRQSMFDETTNLYWIAANSQGLIKYKLNVSLDFFKPTGPYLSTAQKMYYHNGKMLVAPGKSWDDRGGIEGALLVFENEKWSEYTSQNSGVLSFTNQFLDVVSIAVDPHDDNKLYVSTWGEGVFVFENGQVTQLYNGINAGVIESALPNSTNYYNFYRIDGLCFDDDNNLWMLNSLAGGGIKIMKKDGSWISLSYPSLSSQPLLRDLLINSKNQKWITSATGSGNGVFVLDDNKTIEDTSDDKTVFFSSFKDKDGNEINPSYIYTIAEDREGTIWIGTDKGPILMTNVTKVFNSDYTCTRVKIPRNDGTSLADYLLDDEKIKAIAIDGANRKWIGTESSGIYLLSEDGKETIYHFTTDNSPLSSNKIDAVTIDEKTGEVFFATDEGILSYRSDATEPVNSFSKIQVFPNPVRPGYEGLITIRGLEENTQVKIVNVSGELVFEGISTGGSLAWNGKNYSNSKVPFGVYYVLCTSEDGIEKIATKILIVR